MRLFYVLALLLVLAACGKSQKEYQPGDSFTESDEAADRMGHYVPMKPVDKTELRLVPRIEEVVIPAQALAAESSDKVVEQAPQKVQLLMNQMQLEDTKISVGKKAGLVRFSAKAVVEGKVVDLNLEGHLKEDSTADLINVVDSDDNARAEVFCRGEVREKFYECDSLFVDLYYKIADNKFFREQLEIESDQEKALKAKEAAASLAAAEKSDEEQNLEEEGDHGHIPEPLGTYVGRPERVKELFALTEKKKPVPAEKPPVKEQPVGKGPNKKDSKKEQPQKQPQKPSAESMKDRASISQRKKSEDPAAPKPKPSATPKPKAPAQKATPKPATKPVVRATATPAPVVVKPQPTPQPKPQPQPKPKPTAKPEVKVETPTVKPAKVILDINDEPNRPVDQAVGGYSGGGKLENASTLSFAGDHHYFSKPHERQNYATYDLVRVVKIMAGKIFKDIFPGVKIRINDFSKRRGGYIPPHQGHQNGLEADIGYLTENSHKKVPQHSKIGSKWVLKMKEMWSVFKFLGGSDRVSLFYVNRSVKPRFCSYARQQGELSSDVAKLALRKMVAIGGHTSHFHLRMECSRYNPRCRTDGPPARSTGC